MSFIRTKFVTAYRAKWYPNSWDILAFMLVVFVLSMFAWNAGQMTTPYQVGQTIPISLKSSMLPWYAGRTVVRMLIAMICSLVFTFVFGTWAAKSARAERIIIPALDVLQSVPILGFLSVTVAGFIALFPGSMLGPECAAIFAIFTSQAWNMAFGFYQTVRSVPKEVQEAAKMLQLNSWQRFWRIEVPYSMPGLLWNAMASMSAGWFFVVAAEAIQVSNQEILLPGIGSFIAVAILHANMQAIGYAVLTMFIVIIAYDQLLFRPLVAWADKFKSDHHPSEHEPESWVVDLMRRTRLFRKLGSRLAEMFDHFVNLAIFKPTERKRGRYAVRGMTGRVNPVFWDALLISACAAAIIFLAYFILSNLTLREVAHTFYLGLITTLRVFVAIVICSLIWVPIGVKIGLSHTATRIAQPVAQILAAFPANLVYPFVVILIVQFHLNPNVWLTPLMILGAQWYILYNVIAGASLIPKELLQVADNLGVTGWLRWSRFLLPAVFPYYVTGAITASGGAWNASIVAEVASWGNEKLVATGLGAYIAEYTTAGNFSKTVLGIGMMSFLVLLFNRLVWRPLYAYAETRFVLE